MVRIERNFCSKICSVVNARRGGHHVDVSTRQQQITFSLDDRPTARHQNPSPFIITILTTKPGMHVHLFDFLGGPVPMEAHSLSFAGQDAGDVGFQAINIGRSHSQGVFVDKLIHCLEQG